MNPRQVVIVGAGPAGLALALLLARRGHSVRIYERRTDPRTSAPERGRSINLVLAARGLRALEAAGVAQLVEQRIVPMRGRMVHDEAGAQQLVPYGQRADEQIFSVSRAQLTRLLVEAAARAGGIELEFGVRCLGAGPAAGELALREERSGREWRIEAPLVFGADGAGSAVRESLVAAGRCREEDEPLAHDYKELSMPPGSGLDPGSLHIWPRGDFMLIALPNTDASFTATLFLPRTGPVSFERLRSDDEVRDFFTRHFPDAVPLVPQLTDDFRHNPQGELGTLHCWPWQVDGRLLLVGDAAHAIVPFHGQGMNCALEDCRLLDEQLAAADEPAAVLADYERRRRPDTDAIAEMALENYLEMRDTVRAPHWQRQKELALELERRWPDRFVPRYSMVMFHAEIPYSVALERGRIQQRLLDELAEQEEVTGAIDWAHAAARIARDLPPLR